MKLKKLVGGGSMQIVNQTIPRALRRLGYAGETVEAVVEHVARHGHVIDAPGLKPEHYQVFDTAMGPRPIAPMGHLTMMAAVQPFLSGAISKTVNLPESATADDVARLYVDGWKKGLKALAIYRDNCKVGQPLSGARALSTAESAPTPAEPDVPVRAVRRRLPKQRPSITTSFTVAGAEGYLTAGSYPDDGLGEIFLRLGKQGSTLAGVMDAFSIAISIGLQHGVPLEIFVEKFMNLRFEPAGITDDPDVQLAQSIMDYVFRRLALDHLTFENRSQLGVYTTRERTRYQETGSYQVTASDVVGLVDLDGPSHEDQVPTAVREPVVQEPATTDGAQSTSQRAALQVGRNGDAPLCMSCGITMRRSGTCYVCEGCGSSSGCS